jgi:hypothetical protein
MNDSNKKHKIPIYIPIVASSSLFIITGALVTLFLLLKKKAKSSSSTSTSTTYTPVTLQVPASSKSGPVSFVLLPGQFGYMSNIETFIPAGTSATWIASNNITNWGNIVLLGGIYVDSVNTISPSQSKTFTINQDTTYPSDYIVTNNGNTAAPGGLMFYNNGSETLNFTLDVPRPSDRRLKKDIELTGEKLGTLPIYSYRYVWENSTDKKSVGVMADEVIAAGLDQYVRQTSSGYYVVLYNQLRSHFNA